MEKKEPQMVSRTGFFGFLCSCKVEKALNHFQVWLSNAYALRGEGQEGAVILMAVTLTFTKLLLLNFSEMLHGSLYQDAPWAWWWMSISSSFRFVEKRYYILQLVWYIGKIRAPLGKIIQSPEGLKPIDTTGSLSDGVPYKGLYGITVV